jgi:hypothetical protein
LRTRNKSDSEIKQTVKTEECSPVRRKRTAKQAESCKEVISKQIPQMKRAKESVKGAKKPSSLSLKTFAGKKQTTMESFFKKSPTSTIQTRSCAASLPDTPKSPDSTQTKVTEEKNKEKPGARKTSKNDSEGENETTECSTPKRRTRSQSQSPAKTPVHDIADALDNYPMTPKADGKSALANLQKLAKNLRTPVKSTTAFPHYDPKEEVGLEEYADLGNVHF